jgi:type II secretory ATPase GspE/PulE/Tfp pilus assembly ATPase PilB-like protein
VLTAQAIAQAYLRHGCEDTHQAATSTGDGAGPAASTDFTQALLDTLEQDAGEDDLDKLPNTLGDNALVRLIHTLIIDAHQQGASDIHIETYPGRRKMRIRLRKDGRLVPVMELPHTYRSALVARLKIMCDLDISERRKPQDGKIDFSRFSPQHRLELRVSTIPTTQGAEDVVMRLLSTARPVSLTDLNLTDSHLHHLQSAIQRPHGLVLCVGPTGSGKTTTLHALLQALNTSERKIWTAEDPIEITQPDLRQVQVNPKLDWTFAKALRTFLRADPDVIMVGEVRDTETAQVTVEASLTGHLVLSTLHTNSAVETVVRLLDMGLDPFNFADSLVAVLAQRLVRRLCTQCSRVEAATDAWVEELLADYLHHFPAGMAPKAIGLRQDWLRQYGQQGVLKRAHAPGCAACNHTGYKGRTGVHELLLVNAAMRRLIQRKASPDDLRQVAMDQGQFLTLRQDGILKVLQGYTSMEEVRSQCSD